jgi:tripartite-type tricarboxylate transporter receptor subunit TctC
MKRRRCKFSNSAAGAAALAVVSATLVMLSDHSASYQTTRTIKVVVPFPPGGGADIVARLLADQIGRAQGPTILVENRPGAASVIGTEVVSRAAPDGNTVLVPANSFLISAFLKKLTYDPLTSFEPICNLARSPHVLAVNSDSPYKTLGDLINAARAKPGELTLASVGPASAQHIAFEMLKRRANIDVTFVPFAGNAPAVNSLLGGHVTSVLVNYPEVAEQLHAGKLRALAMTLRERIEQLPSVPTVAESGYTDFETDTWIGLMAPARTPKETITQLSKWFMEAMQVPEVKAKLVKLGLYPVGTCGAEFAGYLRKQYDDYRRVIREANIKAE